MKKIPTKGKAQFVLPKLIECRGGLWSPKITCGLQGNILIFEPVISTDEGESMKICKCGGEVVPILIGDETYYKCKDCNRINQYTEEEDNE